MTARAAIVAVRGVAASGALLAGLFAAILGATIELHVHRVVAGKEHATVVGVVALAVFAIVASGVRAWIGATSAARGVLRATVSVLLGAGAFAAFAKVLDRAVVRPFDVGDASVGWALVATGAALVVASWPRRRA